jgi:Asp-tRNA(Asn)/Glu-tRNA(Gln) amidotransferase B subunit
LTRLCTKILDNNPAEIKKHHQELEKYGAKAKKGTLRYLVGQVLKETGGKANPKRATEILEEMLSKRV